MRPEFREDPLSGSRIIFAPQRGDRPQDYSQNRPDEASGRCPFCRGAERETPPAVAEYTLPNTLGPWQVRVVPNKFPAVNSDLPPDFSQPGPAAGPATGLHEVIVESPEHHRSFTQLSPAQQKLVLRAYGDRLRAARDAGWAYGLVFKNVGAAAGASLEHTHSQMLALPFLPQKIGAELAITREHYQRHQRTLLRDVLERELNETRRIILQLDPFVAFCPYASRTPYETWIVPRTAWNCFEGLPDDALEPLAACIHSILRRLESLVPAISYNLLLHTNPFDTSFAQHYHWRMEILPRVTKLAGFEWATGCFINTILPEDAAAQLRQVDPDGSSS